ncbi:MAG: sulfonate transport system substrate-binding protein [Nocardioidaceae bacterium]|nr:sulfonate transport system substrate-binding protein [Nocardioidaceae bacterium]
MVTQKRAWTRLGLVLAAGVVATSLAACSSSSNPPKASTSPKPGGTHSSTPLVGGSLTLGYFPNLTHGSAIVGVQKGYFKSALAKDGASFKTALFTSGSDTLSALAGGSLDASFMGPAPAITAFAQSHGNLVRVISGATEGGASLMVNKSITSIADLKGKTIATPSAGNTQDVALKYFLKQHGFHESSDGTGDVTIVNQDNGTTLQTFAQGQIDGAWVPEPYATQMEAAGAKRLVNESSLWPKGKFVTTVLVVRTAYMQQNPQLVNDLLTGQVQANDYINQNSTAAEKVVGDWLDSYNQSTIPQAALNTAWSNLKFTDDPIANSFIANEKHEVAIGLLDPVSNLGSIFDLDPLNKILTANNEPTVAGPSVQ